MIDYDRAALNRELERDEGRKRALYFDNAKPPRLTGGVGWNFSDNGLPEEVRELLPDGWFAQLGAELTDAAIDRLLDIAVGMAERGLSGLLPHWRDLDAARQRVFLNMCFNLGAHELGGFKHMLAAANMGDWERVAAEMRDSAWFRQVGVRATRLVAMVESGLDTGNVA